MESFSLLAFSLEFPYNMLLQQVGLFKHNLLVFHVCVHAYMHWYGFFAMLCAQGPVTRYYHQKPVGHHLRRASDALWFRPGWHCTDTSVLL